MKQQQQQEQIQSYDLTGAGALPGLAPGSVMTTGIAAPAPAVLTAFERRELEKYEEIIEHGLKTFVDVGAALQAIKEQKLYRQSHANFEDYCRAKWGFTARRANQFVASADVVKGLISAGAEVETAVLPATESQARPLTAVAPAKRAEVWSEAVETAKAEGREQPAARHVEAAARRHVTAKPVERVIEAESAEGLARADVVKAKLFLEVIEEELVKLNGLTPASRNQAVYHLAQASEHLGCWKALMFPREKESYEERGNRRAREAAGRAAQSARDKAAASGQWFVVCREPMAGVSRKAPHGKPRYATSFGWTTDPNKALKYNHFPDAREAAGRDGVMALAKAIRRWEKGL